MSDAFIGEIRMFSGNYAPENWAICDGRLIPISNNEALYSLLGTNYGGDGRTTFALPDLRGRLPVGQGAVEPGAQRTLGEQFGTETVALTTANLPQHNHLLTATTAAATTSDPSNRLFADGNEDNLYASPPSQPDLKTMSAETVASAGGSRPHNNIMPSLAVNYIICMFGAYPLRN